MASELSNVLFPQGVLLGLSNTAGVLAGVFGTAATGYILQHGSTMIPCNLVSVQAFGIFIVKFSFFL